jgi:hypothetical protein
MISLTHHKPTIMGTPKTLMMFGGEVHTVALVPQIRHGGA